MITKKGKSVVEVSKGEDISISEIYRGEDLIWKKNEDSYPKLLTGMLDQSISNPTKMYTGPLGKNGTPETNVVSWIRANSHRYVGNYDAERGMILRQLDDNNSELYADGSDASEDIKGINGGDVFMKMPDFWFRGENLDSTNDKYNIHITKEEPTDGKTWVKWDSNTLIGVYKAVADLDNDTDGGLFSKSGVTPTVNVSQDNFKAKARNRSNGNDHFMIVTYEAHQVMALLYILYYGNMNGQQVIGTGTDSYPKVTGQTNIDGMNDTVAENSRSINFWGLENWWGDIDECVDNIRTTGSGNANILTYYGGKIVRSVKGTTNGGYITKMLLGEFLDFIAASASASSSSTTYYCDSGYVNTTTYYVANRSGYAAYLSGGPFSLNVNNSSSFSMNWTGSRLLYNGRVVIEDQHINLKTRSISTPTWKPIDLQYVYHNDVPSLRQGFDFNICNISDYSQLGSVKLSGLNIRYEDIEGLVCDSEGNVTIPNFGTVEDKLSYELTYKGNSIGTIIITKQSEEEVVDENRQKYEREMMSDNRENE